MVDVFVGSFKADGYPLYVTNNVPTDSSNTPVTANIEFDIKDEGGSFIDLPTVVVRLDGEVIFQASSGQNGFIDEVTLIADGFHIKLTHVDPLDFETDYTVEVDASDTSFIPNVMPTFAWTFGTLSTATSPTSLRAFTFDGLVRLVWEKDPLLHVEKFELRRSLDGFPEKTTDGVLIFEDQVLNSYEDFDVVNGTVYYYTIFVIKKYILGVPLYATYDVVSSARGKPTKVSARAVEPGEHVPQRGELQPVISPFAGSVISGNRDQKIFFDPVVGDAVLSPVDGMLEAKTSEGGLSSVDIIRGDLRFRINTFRLTAPPGPVLMGDIIGRVGDRGIEMLVDKLPGRYIRAFYVILAIEKREGAR